MSTSERRDGGIHLSRRQLLAAGAAGGLSLAALRAGQLHRVRGDDAQARWHAAGRARRRLGRHRAARSQHLDGQQPRPRAPPERVLEARRLRRQRQGLPAARRVVRAEQERDLVDGQAQAGRHLARRQPAHRRRRRVLPAARARSRQQARLGERQPDDGRPHQDREGRRDDAHDRPQAALVGPADAARPALPGDRQERHQDVHGRDRRRHRPVQAGRLDAGNEDDAEGQPELLRVGQALSRHRRPQRHRRSDRPPQRAAVRPGAGDRVRRPVAGQGAQGLVHGGSAHLLGRRLDADRDEHEGRPLPRRARAAGDEAAGRPQQARQGRRAGLRLGRQRPVLDPRPALQQQARAPRSTTPSAPSRCSRRPARAT